MYFKMQFGSPAATPSRYPARFGNSSCQQVGARSESIQTEEFASSATCPGRPLRSICHRRLGSGHHTKSNVRRMLGGAKHSMCRLLKILRPGIIDVRHKFLWIAIDEREPGALDLDHEPVSLLEPVQHV